jgi:hypothetical protein
MNTTEKKIKEVKKIFTWPKEKPITPPDTHHWFCEGNRLLLDHYIKTINPEFILELGSWTGAGSTSFILNNAPNSHVICLDHWSKDWKDHTNGDTTGHPEIDHETGKVKPTDENGNITDLSHVENLWESFLQNTWHHQNHLTPLRAKTDGGLEILHKMNIPIKLIYIDAHHHFEGVVHDVMKCVEYWPNAIIVGDDWTWESVREAVHYCARKLDKRIMHLNTVWTFTDALAFEIPVVAK